MLCYIEANIDMHKQEISHSNIDGLFMFQNLCNIIIPNATYLLFLLLEWKREKEDLILNASSLSV